MQGFGLKDLHGPVRRADVGDVGRCGLMADGLMVSGRTHFFKPVG
jgi:hypothetical protein